VTTTRRRGPTTDEAVRSMILLMPRLVGRIKRIPVPEGLRSFDLSPRHLSLLAFLLHDGPLAVSVLARRLEIAPTTASLMVGDLSRQGILERHEDDADRRRTIVSIAEAHRPAIEDWLAVGANAWRTALEPLTPAQRQLVIDTLQTYDRETTAARGDAPPQ
jgi:DNA-binding MarR family transcriptional regulator